jgi:prepilin signal peptidase PulO-like enzyme (type II secretory pathway)
LVNTIAFVLLGLPLAFVADRLIARFALPAFAPDDDDEEERAKRLPWQREPWAAYLRRGVVLLIPVLTGVAGARFEPVAAVVVSLLLVALLVCTATDLLRYRVPNAITYPGTALALVAALLMPDANAMSAALAALLGGGVFLVMAIVTRGGLGLGDVKLAMLIGAALGLPAAYQALALGVVVGGLVILALFLAGFVSRRQAVPYAPFLALTAVVVVLTQGASFAPL